MASIYNPANWYWVVGGHPGVVFSSAEPGYVATADATYVSWLALGNVPTTISPDGALALVLADAGLGEATLALDPTDFTGLSGLQVLRAVYQAGVEVSSTAEVTGSIAGTVLTVSAVAEGSLAIGDLISGSGVGSGIIITSLGTGTGGTGTYNLSGSGIVSSRPLTATASFTSVYPMTGNTWEIMLQTFTYVSAFNEFPNSLSQISWLTRDEVVEFYDQQAFLDVVRAILDYAAAWQQWAINGGDAPPWGSVEVVS
jgi:hypothetical protein